MKVDKSLKEVWDWKDRIYEETKTLSMEDRVNKIRAFSVIVFEFFSKNLLAFFEYPISRFII